MQVIRTIADMRNASAKAKRRGHTLGFVPTMGALHEGHLSLVAASKAENRFTAASIFVNPTQFGPNEDFDRYPRTFDEDCEMLKKAGCDFVFYPSVDEMYDKKAVTVVLVAGLDKRLCGIKRPGHFQGVATVVSKFFNIVQPDKAYFGQKDYQQSVIIRKMVKDLDFPVEVRVMPIVREPDGLAMSSRNRYLTPEQRPQAVILSRALTEAEHLIHHGNHQTFHLIYELEEFVKREAPLAKIDYISFVDPDTLEDLKTISHTTVVALAVYFGKTRLIDNAIIHA